MANKKGIDLCYHQGDIDWKKVKEQGISFIIPRDGWGTDATDKKLVQNVKEAMEAGIEVPAVYHFIYGINAAEAKQNAACAINNVRKAGLPPTTIIWCDLEYDTVDNARDYRGVNLTAADQKAIASAFCDYCMEQGYPTGVYVNQDYMTRVYGTDFGQKYDLWLADLEGEAAYQCVYRQTGWRGQFSGISTYVDTDEYYGHHTAGTAKPVGESKEAQKEEARMGKPKSKEYVKDALAILDRVEGLDYVNSFPYNCGYCEGDLTLDGDCWNINPKATTWALYLGEKLSKNYTPGKYYYKEGINASGLPDVGGNEILNNYCTKTTFRKMLEEKKAPCFLLINGQHMGAYLGEFEREGKIYNVSEFSPNIALGKTMRSYVDEYGRRLPYKGYTGDPIGTWNQCGYLTAFLDYSDWDQQQEETPEEPAKEIITDLTLALQIYKGEWGNNPGRQTSITMKYGAKKYAAAQKIVDKIVSAMNWYRIEIQLVEEIYARVWGDNPDRQRNITLKYGANAYRITQGFVNDIEHKEYTLEDLKAAYNVTDGILHGIYGNDPERKDKIVAQFGEKVRNLAQKFVNEIIKAVS